MSAPEAVPLRRSHDDYAEFAPVRPIGQFIRDARKLTDQQIERILAHQRKSGLRFGEAAVALRLADRNDVLQALSKQFEYTSSDGAHEVSSELVAAADPFGDQAEAFRELRSRLLVEVLGEHRQAALAIVSPDLGDGKSYLAANLAVSYSQLGEKTLLVDADLRTPRQHKVLGVAQNGVGLSTVLAGFADSGALVHAVPGLTNLYLAPAGPVPPNPVELLQRPRFAVVIRELLEKFDHVLVDTPAAARGADSRIIAARAGATLIVARKGRSRMAALEGLVGALTRGPARIAGVVVNAH
jgi:chain length determinant protein tyrosine kinase EpsG